MSLSIATLSDFSDHLDTFAKLMRLLEKEDVKWEEFMFPINDRKARCNLARYLKAGCPKMLEAKPEGVVTDAPVPVATDLVHGLFLSPEAQIEQWRKWNSEFKLGISDGEFQQLATSVPAWPEDRLVAVVLTYHFGTPQQEFEFYWPLIARAQERNWKWDQLLFDQDHLRWLSGYENVPGLKWEVIDLGADRNRKPCDVRHPKKSPGASGLAAAALFPDWVRAMDGNKVPYIWLPGCEVSIPGYEAWQGVPCMYFDRDRREVGLHAGWCGRADGGWAVPSSLGRQN